MSGVRAFFDTNVLIYMYGASDPLKRIQALELFHRRQNSGAVLISTQVVQEFYMAGLRKGRIPRPKLLQAIDDLLGFSLITVGVSEIRVAIAIEERFQISFWDALILAAAESGDADILYTEDLNHGQRYGRVLVENPFHAGAS